MRMKITETYLTPQYLYKDSLVLQDENNNTWNIINCQDINPDVMFGIQDKPEKYNPDVKPLESLLTNFPFYDC